MFSYLLLFLCFAISVGSLCFSGVPRTFAKLSLCHMKAFLKLEKPWYSARGAIEQVYRTTRWSGTLLNARTLTGCSLFRRLRFQLLIITAIARSIYSLLVRLLHNLARGYLSTRLSSVFFCRSFSFRSAACGELGRSGLQPQWILRSCNQPNRWCTLPRICTESQCTVVEYSDGAQPLTCASFDAIRSKKCMTRLRLSPRRLRNHLPRLKHYTAVLKPRHDHQFTQLLAQ